MAEEDMAEEDMGEEDMVLTLAVGMVPAVDMVPVADMVPVVDMVPVADMVPVVDMVPAAGTAVVEAPAIRRISCADMDITSGTAAGGTMASVRAGSGQMITLSMCGFVFDGCRFGWLGCPSLSESGTAIIWPLADTMTASFPVTNWHPIRRPTY
jgi:hypothetical protein